MKPGSLVFLVYCLQFGVRAIKTTSTPSFFFFKLFFLDIERRSRRIPKSSGRVFSQTDHLGTTSIQMEKLQVASPGRDSPALCVVSGGCLCLLTCASVDGHSGGFLFGADGSRAAVRGLVCAFAALAPPFLLGVCPVLRPVTPPPRVGEPLVPDPAPSAASVWRDLSWLVKVHFMTLRVAVYLLPPSFAFPSFVFLPPFVHKQLFKCLVCLFPALS